MTPIHSHTDSPLLLSFKNMSEWRSWLTENHTRQEGLWLRLYKKNSGIASITYDDALDEALCFGWIDGQKKSYDPESWIQKFTPRRAKSMWSKRNQDHVARLIREKRMTIYGEKEIERAKKDGRWEAAYDSPKNMTVPADFMNLLTTDKNALDFYKTLNKANTYAITWRLQTASSVQIRKKRLESLFTMMKNGKKLHE